MGIPRGKIEPGENALSALKRELREELGIEVQEARAYMQVRHEYHDRHVLLDVWRISRYQGTPHGRKARKPNAFCTELPQLDFPKLTADPAPTLAAPLYLISDSRRFERMDFLRRWSVP